MYISVCVKTFTGREDIILTHATIALYATQGVSLTPQIHTKFDGSSSNSERHQNAITSCKQFSAQPNVIMTKRMWK